jgi:uncharacterized protein with FMN-binding domain
MDNNLEHSSGQSSSGNKLIIPAIAAGVLVIALIAFFALGMNKNNTASLTEPTQQETAQITSAPTAAAPITGTEAASANSSYKDGEYHATGHYVSPGGPRDVDVTLTLKDGVITDAAFQGHATDPNSKHFQGEFKANFQPMVVGKNIDDVELTKVAGSSLSPKGFMDAVSQIKNEAKA